MSITELAESLVIFFVKFFIDSDENSVPNLEI